ncbi:MAG: amidohydrolase family protein [Acidobacteriota bacterium]
MSQSTSSKRISRRSLIKAGSAAGVVASGAFPESAEAHDSAQRPGVRATSLQAIRQRVEVTPIVDTHEHLIEEQDRLSGKHPRIQANDWSFLLSHYLNNDLTTSGMPTEASKAFFSPTVDPIDKWKLLAPYWPRVLHTGYAQAVSIAMQRIYGVGELSERTVRSVQEGYTKTIQPGFYRKLLQQIGNIESCQVNSLERPFMESRQPTLLMQDVNISGMHMGPSIDTYASAAGVKVTELSDWHRVIDWWFATYGSYAVAVKSTGAYSRNLDYEDIPAEQVEGIFKRRLNRDPLSPEEHKRLQDHLFWYCVRKATENNLPVKLHTGYYTGANSMPLQRLQGNAAAAADLCRKAPNTRFVFMHINYPSYEDLIAVAKHYTNCYVDMCWSWIISPVASVNFLKQYLVTAPANKVLTFGGDYIPVEPVIGHVALARQGIALALEQLVQERWLTLNSAVDLVESLLPGNARALFNLEEKTRRLQKAPWLST